jgi:hypothetical protein
VRGGPFGKSAPTKVPLKRLVTKSLCLGHNKALSGLDQAGIDLVNSFRRTHELRLERAQDRRTTEWQPVCLRVDGIRIERWLVKWALSALPIFRRGLGGWQPPPEVSELAFGTRPFPPGEGLHVLAAVGDQVANAEHIEFAYVTRADDNLPVGLAVAFRGGYRFVCSWAAASSHNDGSLLIGRSPIRANTLLRRPNRFDFDDAGRSLGLSLHFDWTGTWSPEQNAEVVGIRARYAAPPR